MNQVQLLFLQVTHDPARLFQNGLMVFVCIAGFHICSKFTEPKSPQQDRNVLVGETRKKSLIRIILYLICFIWIAVMTM